MQMKTGTRDVMNIQAIKMPKEESRPPIVKIILHHFGYDPLMLRDHVLRRLPSASCAMAHGSVKPKSDRQSKTERRATTPCRAVPMLRSARLAT